MKYVKGYPVNITKKTFWQFINEKINRQVSYAHVFSVISILFDEIPLSDALS